MITPTLTFIASQKFAQATYTTSDFVVFSSGWSKAKETKLQMGDTTIAQEAKQVSIKAHNQSTLNNYTLPQMMEIAEDLLTQARDLFLSNIPAEEIAENVEKAKATRQNSPVKAAPKISQAQLDKIAMIDEIKGMDDNQRIAFINSLGVFHVSGNQWNLKINVSTHKTLALVNYKKCMKLAGGEYMKVINFTCINDLATIFELADISRKTAKQSQDTLEKSKKERLTRKHTSKSNGKPYGFKEWYDDADMPTKVNGKWVDLETGMEY